VRLLLAVILGFGSEVLLWTNLTGRSTGEWLLLVPGYLALSTVLLDLLARYRIRDLAGLMTLAGIYGLLNALMLNPNTTLFDVPRTLVTRVTGAHTLLGLEMLILFLTLTGGNIRSLRWVLLIGAAGVGLAWGTWVRWSPGQADVPPAPISIEGMLLAGAVGVSLIALLTWQVYRRGATLTPAAMILDLREGLVVAIVLLALILIRLAQNTLNTPAIFLITVLSGLCFAIIWFRKGTKHTPIIDYHLPVHRLPPIWMGLAIGILLWTGIFAYSLPLLELPNFDQLTFVIYGFTLYGLAWLPAVSLFIGLRAYIRQVQATPL
jgi:hypothetical protein